MKLKVTNITAAGLPAIGVQAVGGIVSIAPGDFYEGEFTDNEAIGLNAMPTTFKVEGFTQPEPQAETAPPDKDTGKRDLNNDTEEMAAMRAKFDRSYEALGKERDKLAADLATVTTERDGLKSELSAALEKLQTTGGGDTTKAEPLTLDQAIDQLDDANDAHWTQAGKPSLEHLQHVTQNANLKRADIDALNITRAKA